MNSKLTENLIITPTTNKKRSTINIRIMLKSQKRLKSRKRLRSIIIKVIITIYTKTIKRSKVDGPSQPLAVMLIRTGSGMYPSTTMVTKMVHRQMSSTRLQDMRLIQIMTMTMIMSVRMTGSLI